MGTPTPGTGIDFVVDRANRRTCRLLSATLPEPLGPGQVRFRVDRFALTANNVTYALTGDMLGYWTFFPAPPPWGRIPAMGFADVLASRHPDVAEGERVFGFFPMSTHLTIDADDVRATQYVDTAPHRRDTALPYRQYTRVAGDPLYEPAREDQHALLRGLFITSFLVNDFLADQDGFGARTLLVSSASSKTAIALAFLAARRGSRRVVGLTSSRNRALVERLGCSGRRLGAQGWHAPPPARALRRPGRRAARRGGARARRPRQQLTHTLPFVITEPCRRTDPSTRSTRAIWPPARRASTAPCGW